MFAEDVLHIFQDWQHLSTSFDSSGEPPILLEFDSTIEQFLLACRIDGDKHLGRLFNRIFRTAVSDEQWIEILSPLNSLRSLCDFISEKSQLRLSVNSSVRIPVTADRMYKVMRSRLIDKGMSLGDAPPSTLMEPFIVQHFELLADTVWELAPGALPRPDLRWKSANPVSVVVAFCLIYVLFQLLYRYSASVFGSILLTGLVVVLMMKLWDKHHASSYFKDFRTFADLVLLMVVQRNCLDDTP